MGMDNSTKAPIKELTFITEVSGGVFRGFSVCGSSCGGAVGCGSSGSAFIGRVDFAGSGIGGFCVSSSLGACCTCCVFVDCCDTATGADGVGAASSIAAASSAESALMIHAVIFIDSFPQNDQIGE
jgi:hypothetical protein